MDEKSLEYIHDAKSCSGTMSDCCGDSVYNDDICGACGEHCTAIYEEIECPVCGGSIIAAEFEHGYCQDCGRNCKDIIE
jgi:DNA-directed RNA polymerase subunit RPC12/RpoP